MNAVGWYVHHHGAGHLTRFLAVRPHLDAEVVAFSTLPAPTSLPERTTWIVLDRDDDPLPGEDGTDRRPQDSEPTAGGLFHWAPLAHPGHTRRLAVVAAALASRPFAAFVVDVSVELTLLVRLLGVPVVVLTQPGDRTDTPHRLAYDAAARIIAPWPAGAYSSAALDRVAGKVVEVGGISRFSERERILSPTPGSVLVLGSTGGDDDRLLAAARSTTPGFDWRHVGGSSSTWVDDPWELLHRAEVVVSAAGQNSVADLAAVGARAVLIPQDRPFDEQRTTARRVGGAGLAVVEDTWPDAARWPAILDRARALSPQWSSWQVRGAAERAARTIADVAGRGR